MMLIPQLVALWPKLAWVAQFTTGHDKIKVLHGPRVEVNDQWCVEAVWAGDYALGDFDQTDLVFGSGVRCRNNSAVFVNSGTTLDRLWHYCSGGNWYVANSFPALLAVADLSVADLPGSYARDVDTIMLGLAGYKRQLPCKNGQLGIVYFNNLLWDGQQLREIDKVDTAPTFKSYEIYADYLMQSADHLAANMDDSARTHSITPLVTVSQGYDSLATAVVARRAGCRKSVTISQATSLWRGSDSGEDVARTLGLECTTYNRTASRYPLEETIWSVSGRAGVINWTLFDYPEPLSLFFTGPYGDKIWNRKRWNCRDPFQFTGLSLGGIGEFRLFKGIFHCPLPFIGMRHFHELWDISFSEEMMPWSVGGDYDRPIPRRMVEEAGIPRSAFGQRKKNTSHDEALLWPYSAESVASFRNFLAAQDTPAAAPSRIWLRRRGAKLAHLIEANMPRSLTTPVRLRRKEAMVSASELLFRWANTELKQTYRTALVDSIPDFRSGVKI